MLLQQLIQQPTTSSKLVVFDPFRMPEPSELVKEVIGLANADVEGPRYILFGVNPGAIEGSKVVGIKDDVAAVLKKAHRVISAHIEPVVSLAFIFDQINGKLAGALEIDGGGDGPFVPGEDFAADDTGKKTWVREGRELRIVDISELGAVPAKVSTEEPEEEAQPEPIEIPDIHVGLNEDPDCGEIQLSIPDTSNPPFADEKKDGGSETSLTQSLKSAVHSMTSTLAGLTRVRPKDDEDSSTDVVKAAQDLITEAENYYYFEEKALHLNFSVLNTGELPVDEVHIEFGFPKIDDFDIADRIHMSPFDKSSHPATKNKGYPEVDTGRKGFIVRNKIGLLQPATPTPALRCPIRMAVGPGAQMRKMAILYTLRRGDEVIGEGRMKIRFGKVVD
ncbi:MAG: ATP-binding protein [Gammaproteobacteria bacterium]|nr:ATP-binding protein [Gammaproteobacteria bacterium]